MTKSDVGQLLSDQVSSYLGRKEAKIEPEPFDDELGLGNETLTRWGDRRYKAKSHDWRD